MAFTTRRVPVPGSDKAATRSPRIGTPPATESISVTVHLRERGGADPLDAFVGHLAEQDLHARRFLTRSELAERHGAAATDIDAVRTFARRHHLFAAHVDAARRTVALTGSVQDMEAAFGTSLSLHADGRGVFRARQGSLTVPAALAPAIVAVLGLDSRPAAHAHFRIGRLDGNGGVLAARASGRRQGFDPTELADLYAFPPNVDGTGQTIAVIELGGGFRDDDLDEYFAGLGLPRPKVTAVGVGRAANRPTGDPSGADGEVALDIEVIGAVAPGAHIVVYFAENTSQGFADAILAAVHDDVHRPSVISISWGLAEDAGGWSAQSRRAMDEAFLAAASVGATVFAAAGDDSATDGVDDGQLHTDFPASSPRVVGCGGTRLTASNGAITRESVWHARGSGTGGGVSRVYPVPDFQAEVSPPPTSGRSPHAAGRGVPDVAGVADPATGYRVLVDGQSAVIGGTSAVAPLWAGLTARIQQKLGAPVAPFLPTLYRHATAFNDISSGSNGDYHARRGWDACTGLGSPNGTALLQAMVGVGGTPPPTATGAPPSGTMPSPVHTISVAPSATKPARRSTKVHRTATTRSTGRSTDRASGRTNATPRDPRRGRS